MTRRGEQLTRVALRLGLLLGGVVAVWGAHEIATAGTAYAADRPAPVSVAAHRVTNAPGPPVGSARSRTDPTYRIRSVGHRPPTGTPPCRSAPHRRAHVTDTRTPRHRPAPHRPARHQPADRPPAPTVRPGLPASAAGLSRPAVRPGEAAPDPLPDALRPVTYPVGAAPTRPLGPVLLPAWDGLGPVLDPLDPALKRLKSAKGGLAPHRPAKNPHTDQDEDEDSDQAEDSHGDQAENQHGDQAKGPHTDPSKNPSTKPARVPPAVPAPAADPVGSTSSIRPVTAPAAGRVAPVDTSHPASHPARWSATANHPAPSRPAQPLGPDLAHPTGTHTPGTTGAGAPTTGHGELADASAAGWTPPAQSGRRCHPANDDARPSRAPRPGTRPA